MKDTQTDILRYQLVIQSLESEIAKLKSLCERYRTALNISSSQAEKALREKLAAVLLERDSLREQLQRVSTRPREAAFANFLVTLDIATTFDAADYANWVRDHAVELSVGFQKSDEDDQAVYGRMQYVRSQGLGG